MDRGLCFPARGDSATGTYLPGLIGRLPGDLSGRAVLERVIDGKGRYLK